MVGTRGKLHDIFDKTQRPCARLQGKALPSSLSTSHGWDRGTKDRPIALAMKGTVGIEAATTDPLHLHEGNG